MRIDTLQAIPSVIMAMGILLSLLESVEAQFTLLVTLPALPVALIDSSLSVSMYSGSPCKFFPVLQLIIAVVTVLN